MSGLFLSRFPSDLNEEQKRLLVLKEENLVKAAKEGDLETVKKLVDDGADVNACNYMRQRFYNSFNYYSPLHHAVESGSVECVAYLLSFENTEIHVTDRFDITSLHVAAHLGHSKIVQLLVDKGADLNGKTKSYKSETCGESPFPGASTPLHLAVLSNNHEAVRVLLEAGADHNATDDLQRNSLAVAAEMHSEELVLIHISCAIGKELLSFPHRFTGDTPLHYCIRAGLKSAVNQLVLLKADAGLENFLHYSPFHEALRHSGPNRQYFVNLLLSHGFNCKVDVPGKHANTVCCICGLLKEQLNGSPKNTELVAAMLAWGLQPRSVSSLLNKLVQRCRSLDGVRDECHPALDVLVQVIPRPLRNTFLRSVSVQSRKWLREHVPRVPSLLHQSRIAVRRQLQPRQFRHLSKLQIPETLKNYLVCGYYMPAPESVRRKICS